jgi:ribosomal protein S18 acetylase RimI-like enzyme
MPVHARFATRDDVPQLAGLFDRYRQFYEQALDPELARRFIAERMEKQESVILVAEVEQGILAGFCQMYPTFCSVAAARIVVLYDLFVDAGWRRHGVGRTLMQAAETYAAGAGYARMDLATARTNHQAQALYESLGWIRDEAFYTYSRQLD